MAMVRPQNQKHKLTQGITMSTMVQDTVDPSIFFSPKYLISLGKLRNSLVANFGTESSSSLSLGSDQFILFPILRTFASRQCEKLYLIFRLNEQPQGHNTLLFQDMTTVTTRLILA